MTQKITYLFLVFLVKFSGLNAQSCPANIDFESGTGAWNYYRGSVSSGPVFTLTATAPVAGLHTIMSGSGTDPYGGFPVVAPGGGLQSLKLGHDSANNSAERATYFLHVPGTGNFTLEYNYAIVYEMGMHPAADEARFIVSATDSITGTAVSCATYSFLATGSEPGFQLSSSPTPYVFYRDWTKGHMKFAGLAGQTIRLDVTAAGCILMDHWCYGYFDMSCNLYEDSTYPCSTGSLTLSSPFGYQGYHWYDSATFTTSYGTSQTVVITAPGAPGTYAVILTPYTGYGCADTFYTHVTHATIAGITGASTLCAGSSTTLSDATPGGIWTSSHVSMATVGTASGTVNGIAPGIDTITYSLGVCSAKSAIVD